MLTFYFTFLGAYLISVVVLCVHSYFCVLFFICFCYLIILTSIASGVHLTAAQALQQYFEWGGALRIFMHAGWLVGLPLYCWYFITSWHSYDKY